MIRTVLEQVQDLRVTELLHKLLLVEARLVHATGNTGGHMERAFFSRRTGADSGAGKRCLKSKTAQFGVGTSAIRRMPSPD